MADAEWAVILHTFKVLPRRWVVERTNGWIMNHRRCVRGFERLRRCQLTIRSSVAGRGAGRIALRVGQAKPADEQAGPGSLAEDRWRHAV